MFILLMLVLLILHVREALFVLYEGLLFIYVCKSQKFCKFTLIYIIQIYFPTFASHVDPIFVILPFLVIEELKHCIIPNSRVVP